VRHTKLRQFATEWKSIDGKTGVALRWKDRAEFEKDRQPFERNLLFLALAEG
jgi:hypothetical protein